MHSENQIASTSLAFDGKGCSTSFWSNCHQGIPSHSSWFVSLLHFEQSDIFICSEESNGTDAFGNSLNSFWIAILMYFEQIKSNAVSLFSNCPLLIPWAIVWILFESLAISSWLGEIPVNVSARNTKQQQDASKFEPQSYSWNYHCAELKLTIWGIVIPRDGVNWRETSWKPCQ